MWMQGYYRNSFTVQEIKNETEWKIDEPKKCISDNCPEVKDKTTVTISMVAYAQIKTLCRLYPNLEWMAGLIGKIGDTELCIEELKLFEQKVTGSTVELTDKGNKDMAEVELIGWIHSHNTMNTFLSDTDVSTANFSTISLCVNNDLDFTGKIRKQLPCGRFGLIEVDIEIETEYDDKIEGIAKELIKTNDITREEAIENYQQYCLYCGKKVGKKNGRKVDGGLVHRKCMKKYLDDLRMNGFSAEIKDTELEDKIWEDEFGNKYCQYCHQPLAYCRCDWIMKDYIRD